MGDKTNNVMDEVIYDKDDMPRYALCLVLAKGEVPMELMNHEMPKKENTGWELISDYPDEYWQGWPENQPEDKDAKYVIVRYD